MDLLLMACNTKKSPEVASCSTGIQETEGKQTLAFFLEGEFRVFLDSISAIFQSV